MDSIRRVEEGDFHDDLWVLAEKIGCECKTAKYFVQDSLGEMECAFCDKIIISQKQVNVLEGKGLITRNGE